MNSLLKVASAEAMLFTMGSAASALVLGPDPMADTIEIQITGGYTTTDATIGLGSELTIGQASVPGGPVDPFVSGITSTGSVDLEGLTLNDFTTGFVGDTFVVDLTTAPSFAFTILTGDVDIDFAATSKSLTTQTSIPGVNGANAVTIEGMGTIDGQDASWSFSIAGSGPSANFTLSIDVPPDLEPIPLPAGGLLLLTGLGAAAFVRRKRA